MNLTRRPSSGPPTVIIARSFSGGLQDRDCSALVRYCKCVPAANTLLLMHVESHTTLCNLLKTHHCLSCLVCYENVVCSVQLHYPREVHPLPQGPLHTSYGRKNPGRHLSSHNNFLFTDTENVCVCVCVWSLVLNFNSNLYAVCIFRPLLGNEVI